MIILGLNAWHGDAAAALIVDGRLVAAVEEERFSRVKHESGFPAHAVRSCLAEVGARISDVDHVAVARAPWARWWRKAIEAVRQPRFAAERARVARAAGDARSALAAAADVEPRAVRARIHRVEHHRAHLASTFFVSPFERAAVLSLDGLGDFASGMWGVGEGNRIRVLGDVAFPHSLGLWYTAVTQFLGFPSYGDEYKVMGLAAYGAPDLLDVFRGMVRAGNGPRYELDMRFFSHGRGGARMSWTGGTPVLSPLFDEAAFTGALGPLRTPRAPIGDRHRAVAASLQARLDELVGGAFRASTRLAGVSDLAYAGGVAHNCVANGRALAAAAASRLYVPPAPGDAGLSIGAALHVWHEVLGRARGFVMDHAHWGPAADDAAMRAALDARGLRGTRHEAAELVEAVAGRLEAGQVVGWFQGRMEFGPRALGARSILADPRRPGMRDRLNERIKRREPFRPFAPSVTAERAGDWFEGPHGSPFMLVTLPVRAGRAARIPAPTHVDGSARVQIVDRTRLPLFAALLDAFERRTGVPVLLNTSFNEDEPIVADPADAVACFERTGLDALALGPWLVDRPA